MIHTRAFILSAAFGALVFTALAFYGDAPQLWSTAANYPLPLLVPVLLLTTANYGLRWLKWRYYLRLIGANQVGTLDSVLLFLSAFAMGLTPGKVGEVVKPYLLRERYGVPVIRSAPILFAERLTDAVAMVALAAAGISYGLNVVAMVVLLAIAVLTVVAIRSPRISTLGLRLAGRVAIVRPRVDAIRQLLASASTLLAPRPLAIAIGLGFFSWGCESVAFFLVLAGLGLEPTLTLLVQATFALASASIFGAASLLPGGLGVAEASLTGFLQLVVGLGRAEAVYATLLIRFCTLWFGVGLGVAALLTLTARKRPRTVLEALARSTSD